MGAHAVGFEFEPEKSSIAIMLNKYLKESGESIQNVANEVNYSRSTISRYLSGKYESDATELETALRGYLHQKGLLGTNSTVLDFGTVPIRNREFYETRDARSVIGVCQACQDFEGMGTIIGPSGYGKTFALQQYAKVSKVAYIACDEIMGCRDLVKAIEKVLGIPRNYGTTWERLETIRNFFNVNKGYLLIIDEADKLISKYTQKKMEILRGIYDQSSVGIVLAGEPKLKALIETFLDRMENRIDFHGDLEGLSPKELKGYLKEYHIEDDAMAELQRRACSTRKSCFRLLDRTLNNIFRIMGATGSSIITLSVITQASDMMPL